MSALAIEQTSTTQSAGLRQRHIQYHKDGNHLCQDSNESEATLKEAMKEVLAYAQEQIVQNGGTMEYKTVITLYDCQEAFHRAGGPPPNEENRSVSMRPDGGIIFATFNDIVYPVFIGEDKVQGTNDLRLAEGKKKQATGNAIERAAKNIRGSEMLCAHMNAFPYVIFASGCDFHESETIAKRIEMMNLGYPNHYLGITPSTTCQDLDNGLDRMLSNTDVEKKMGHGIASVYVKAHKWDEMKHGASRWRKKEILNISKRVIDKTLRLILK